MVEDFNSFSAAMRLGLLVSRSSFKLAAVSKLLLKTQRGLLPEVNQGRGMGK